MEDALVACESGVDALGFVFYAKSKRNVEAQQVADILRELPPFVTTVGLFLEPEPEFVRSVLAVAPLDTLQFHGAESASFCAQFEMPYLKAIGMVGNEAVGQIMSEHEAASGFLLDGHSHGAAGGTGQTFDWSNVGPTTRKPLILAGGITPDNVAEAICTARPWGVDLSSGVEAAPGLKDHSKIQSLMNEVYGADRSN